MGLDITYYREVTLVEACTLEHLRSSKWKHPLCERDDRVLLYNVEDFQERGDELSEGFYAVSSWKPDYKKRTQHDPEGGRFAAGSYSYYNQWREWLASLVGKTVGEIWNGVEPSHFGELINFADNEGFIGPKTSAKLAKDFEALTEKAEHAPHPSLMAMTDRLELFVDFKKAFQIAAGEGVVRFH